MKMKIGIIDMYSWAGPRQAHGGKAAANAHEKARI